MPDVSVNGLRFHTQTLGDPTAPPVVMIHGMVTGNAASWYFGLAPVVARTHSVFVYDQRGHGRSQRPPTGYSLGQLAGDLDGLTGGLGPAAVVGHSFGGVVGLRHAIDHPDRVTALVLVDSFVPSGPVGDRADRSGGAGDVRGVEETVAVAVGGPDRWSTSGSTPPSPEDATAGGPRRPARRPARRRRRPSAEEALLAETTLLDDLRSTTLDPTDLASLSLPVLCAVGADSPFRGDVEALVELLPAEHTQVRVLPGGHALHLDSPDQLADLVTDFLDAATCGGGGSGG
jgi:pimeloyl-ACP methyl ester carboxylesterase